MRIITGLAKGKRLRAPRGLNTRPTLGRVRETLFDILGTRVQDAQFLDLFAGTGAVGIEALSRGARRAVFVDNDQQAIRTIRENLASSGLEGQVEVVRSSSAVALGKLARSNESFDVIFADPPFAKGLFKSVADVIEAHPQLLAENGWCIFQQHHKEPLDAPDCLREFRRKRIGDTVLVFLKHP